MDVDGKKERFHVKNTQTLSNRMKRGGNSLRARPEPIYNPRIAALDCRAAKGTRSVG